jgi:hypothetical protein
MKTIIKRVFGSICVLWGLVTGLLPGLVLLKEDASRAFPSLGLGMLIITLGVWLWQQPKKKDGGNSGVS